MTARVSAAACLAALVLFCWPIPAAHYAAPLEIDEQVTWYVAAGTHPATLFARSQQQSATPPLHFWFARLALDLAHGDSPGAKAAALRLPALVAAAIALVLTATAAWQWFGPSAGAATAILLAAHPELTKAALVSRPYALGMAGFAAALLAWRWLRDRGGWPAWLSLAVAAAVVGWSHYLFAVPAGVALAVLVLGDGGSRRLAACGAGFVAAASALPLLPGVLRVVELGPALEWFTEPPAWHGPRTQFGDLPVQFAVVALLPLAFWKRPPSRRLTVTLSAAWLAGAATLVAAAHAGRPSLGQPRYLLVLLPLAAILGGAAFSAWPRLAIPLALAVALPGAAPRWLELVRHPAWHDSAWKHAAERVLADGQPGRDLVLTQTGLVETRLVPVLHADPGFQEYATGRLGPIYLPGAWRRLSLPLLPPRPGQPGGERWRQAYERELASCRTVWLVAGSDSDIGAGAVRDALDWLARRGRRMTPVITDRVAGVWRSD